MCDMKQLAIDIHGLRNGQWVKPEKAYSSLGFSSKSTYINMIKVLKCMERKNAAANQINYQFNSETCKQSIDDYVVGVLKYDNITDLYSKKENNLGQKYVPNLQQLGIGNVNAQ